MTNYLTDLTDDLVEFDDNPEIITLEPELLEQALEISQHLRNKSRQWQIYFQALALFAFEEWLHKREPSISINRKETSVFQPQYANVIDAVCNLRVGSTLR